MPKTKIALILLAVVLPSPAAAQAGSYLAGIHIGGPAQASIAFGPAYRVRTSLGGPKADKAEYLFAFVEPGVRAGRLSVGYTALVGNLGTGFTLRASMLRTWKPTAETWFGGEISGMPLGTLGPRLGIFYPARGPRAIRIVWDFGIGV
jgi:hypothetical protein